MTLRTFIIYDSAPGSTIRGSLTTLPTLHTEQFSDTSWVFHLNLLLSNDNIHESRQCFPEIRPPSTQLLLHKFSECEENTVGREPRAQICEQSQISVFLKLNTERLTFCFAVIVTQEISFHAA